MADIEYCDLSVSKLATGSIQLDMNCTTGSDGTSHCVRTGDPVQSNYNLPLSTTQLPDRTEGPATSSSCAANKKSYQSWQLEQWHRQYEMAPASLKSGTPTAPSADTGPSFKISNLASADVFNCTPSGKKDDKGIFQGSCAKMGATSNGTASAAIYQFDPKMDMLTIMQQWDCGNS